MPIKRLPIYDLSSIIQAGKINARGLQNLKDNPEQGLKTITDFRKGVEKSFKDYDQNWIHICNGEIAALTDWANRMRFIRSQLDELDRQLAVVGSRLFNWDTVILIMGTLYAFRVATEQTFLLNKELVAA